MKQGAKGTEGGLPHAQRDFSGNRELVLSVREAKAEPVGGAIGLWVDIGTEGYLANLRVTPHPAH